MGLSADFSSKLPVGGQSGRPFSMGLVAFEAWWTFLGWTFSGLVGFGGGFFPFTLFDVV